MHCDRVKKYLTGIDLAVHRGVAAAARNISCLLLMPDCLSLLGPLKALFLQMYNTTVAVQLNNCTVFFPVNRTNCAQLHSK